MHAIVSDDGLPIDDPAALRDAEVAEPTMGPRDVLVRVEAVSVNPVDYKRRLGHRATHGELIVGYDGAGTITAVGDETEGLAVGDEVWWAGDVTRPGANADYQAVDYRIVAKKPTTASFADSASLPLTALTAWEGLFDQLRLSREDNAALLMVGGAGGVGSILIQLAKRLTALKVIATASREHSRTWVKDMGADEVVNHRDLAAEVAGAAPDGVDYIFSAYTRGNIRDFAQIIKPFGHIVSIDGTGEDLQPLFAKSVSMHWEYMFTRSRFETWDMAEQSRVLSTVADLVDRGDIVTTATEYIDDFTANGIREAHRMVESGQMVGKVVVHR